MRSFFKNLKETENQKVDKSVLIENAMHLFFLYMSLDEKFQISDLKKYELGLDFIVKNYDGFFKAADPSLDLQARDGLFLFIKNNPSYNPAIYKKENIDAFLQAHKEKHVFLGQNDKTTVPSCPVTLDGEIKTPNYADFVVYMNENPIGGVINTVPLTEAQFKSELRNIQIVITEQSLFSPDEEKKYGECVFELVRWSKYQINTDTYKGIVNGFFEFSRQISYPPTVDNFNRFLKIVNALNCYDETVRAYFSSNPNTYNEHRDERDLFFKKLALSIADSPEALNQFVEAMNEDVRRASEEAKKKHASDENIGIVNRFLLGKVIPDAWLSELDILQLLNIMNLRHIHVGKFNEDFILEKILEDFSESKTHSHFIVNFAEGHWFEIFIFLSIDENKKWNIKYSDSMHDAVFSMRCYQEFPIFFSNLSNQLFPEYVFVEYEYTPTPQQTDRWSCGYRAMLAAMNRYYEKPDCFSVEEITQLFCNPSAETMRDIFNRVLLKNSFITDEQYKSSIQKLYLVRKENGYRFLSDVVDFYDALLASLCLQNESQNDLATKIQIECDQEFARRLQIDERMKRNPYFPFALFQEKRQTYPSDTGQNFQNTATRYELYARERMWKYYSDNRVSSVKSPETAEPPEVVGDVLDTTDMPKLN